MCDFRIPITAGDEVFHVPCRKCYACRRRKIDEQVFRAQNEDKLHKTSWFITLTYDTENVPISKNGFMTLKRSDLSLFIKNLKQIQRRNGSENKIAWLGCGEYGTKKRRPHYHLIIWGCDTAEYIYQAWNKKGAIHFDYGIESGAIGYVNNYIFNEGWKKAHDRDDREPEFYRRSNNMGENYLNAEILDYHRKQPLLLSVSKTNGDKIAMPSYIRNKIWNKDERKKLRPKIEKIMTLKQDLKYWEHKQKANTEYKDFARQLDRAKKAHAHKSASKRGD